MVVQFGLPKPRELPAERWVGDWIKKYWSCLALRRWALAVEAGLQGRAWKEESHCLETPLAL